ncbi:hypothetical protein C1Y63_08735 [Corynebacterium sp. 13CS0277]|uniref:hypothetical protein n=1 Tax=Corynebacterium sp. 13CS0277 TaxID=2071994 RepID=UPI000D03FD31|nr:hypothetical protein [Corynebacterium sp. 13CS0277]PRQ10940.1 hypothetical protein C1Y63_08735 [Corynebacterium sp. 13CS0277]
MLDHTAAVALRDAILATSGVAGMSGGRFGEIALPFPGERVKGLRDVDGVLDVHLVADLSAKRNLFDTAADVEALALDAGAARVLVSFDDAHTTT